MITEEKNPPKKIPVTTMVIVIRINSHIFAAIFTRITAAIIAEICQFLKIDVTLIAVHAQISDFDFESYLKNLTFNKHLKFNFVK